MRLKTIQCLLALAVTGLVAAPGPLRAEVRLPNLFSAHMVLQRSAAAPVWGWSVAGEKIKEKHNAGFYESAKLQSKIKCSESRLPI